MPSTKYWVQNMTIIILTSILWIWLLSQVWITDIFFILDLILHGDVFPTFGCDIIYIYISCTVFYNPFSLSSPLIQNKVFLSLLVLSSLPSCPPTPSLHEILAVSWHSLWALVLFYFTFKNLWHWRRKYFDEGRCWIPRSFPVLKFVLFSTVQCSPWDAWSGSHGSNCVLGLHCVPR